MNFTWLDYCHLESRVGTNLSNLKFKVNFAYFHKKVDLKLILFIWRQFRQPKG